MHVMTTERRALVEEHIDIARSEARRFRLEDAESESFLILVEASMTWDENTGAPFGTWVRYLIRARLPQRVAQRGLVRVPHQAYARAQTEAHPDGAARRLVNRAHSVALCAPESLVSLGGREHSRSAEDEYVETAAIQRTCAFNMVANLDNTLQRFAALRFTNEGVVSLCSVARQMGLSTTDVLDLERRLLYASQSPVIKQAGE